MALEVRQRIVREEAAKRLPTYVHPYLVISRDTGAGASDIGNRVGTALWWEVLWQMARPPWLRCPTVWHRLCGVTV